MTDKEPSTRKQKKAVHTYHAVIMPESGSPYPVKIEEAEDGTLTHEGMTWVVAPGSVWMDGIKRNVMLPVGSAESLTGAVLAGKTYLRARMFFLMMKMALLEQIFKLQNTKPWFKQSGVWIITGAIGLLALVLVWVASAISGGLENVVDALVDGLRGLDQGTTTPREQAGHNNIAPEG